MARYRGSDGHYVDVECAYAELELYLVLKLQRINALSEGLKMNRLVAVGGATLGGVRSSFDVCHQNCAIG